MEILTKINFGCRITLLFTMICIGAVQITLAQESRPVVPTPVEFMAGHERLYFQMVVKKKFSPESKFGFLSVSALSASYDNEMDELDIAVPILFNYNFYKDFSFVSGLSVNNAVGISPVVGAQHSYSNKEWVAVSILNYFLNGTNKVEFFGIYEYKPQLGPKLNLYTRLQLLYIYGLNADQHTRSYLQLRVGLKQNALSYGIGANLDQYGPEKQFKPNYGIFVGWAF
ncbi:hypothetical protein [Shivajiella indica]|uniref:Uncharacterized protein n=1 Tax=Shivajiella indica TaxID=872115 RepID=A0ABW5B5M1_9BACT